MVDVQPQVYLVAEPVIVIDQMRAYLQDVGGDEWYERVVAPTVLSYGGAGATELVEFCGRLCYRSWAPRLNRNVTKVRKDTSEYLMNILTSRHGSVIQHAHFTFVLHDVSRVVTAELNRHSHTDISEQSFRYVRLHDIRFRMPPVLPDEVQAAGRALLDEMEYFQQWAAEYCGLDNEGDELHTDPPISFFEKKTITSALRRFAPMGTATEEAWTANLRDLRHVIESRTDHHAEEEIRVVANMIAKIMAAKAPYFFQDYLQDYAGHNPEVYPPAWKTENRKV